MSVCRDRECVGSAVRALVEVALQGLGACNEFRLERRLLARTHQPASAWRRVETRACMVDVRGVVDRRGVVFLDLRGAAACSAHASGLCCAVLCRHVSSAIVA